MLVSHNNVKTLYKIPVKDIDSGEESLEELYNTTFIGAVVDQMLNGRFQSVIRERLEFTPEEQLVLEHADNLLRVRSQIGELRAQFTFKLGIDQMTPERARQRQLERLYRLEMPRTIVLAGPVICAGCKETIPVRTKVLQVRGGVCCDHNCFGRLLGAQKSHGD